MLALTVEKREKNQNADILRQGGKLPAVFYGPKQESTPISISAKEFGKVWKKAGESTVVVLKEGTEEHETLIYDVDVHPITGEPRHADFYVMEKGKKVQVAVPVVFEGVAPAIKDKGGILVKVMHELQIEALPKDLPHSVGVDISSLVELTSQILVKDIKLPSGVSLVSGTEEVVVAVTEAKEEPEEPAAPIDLSAIEVEKKGKEAKEGEEGAEAPAQAAPAPEKGGGKQSAGK